jgi:hypothetical protein
MRLIKGIQNALDMNVDGLDKNSVPFGMLTISGGSMTQRQLDLLNRLFTNMKKGITKAWALPVISLQGESKIDFIDLSKGKSNEILFENFLNMLIGMLCMIYRFPARRFGYRISGGKHDAEPMPETSTTAADEDDPGLAPLLGHWETLINEYLLWSRWPHLVFKFTGKNPAEASRDFEVRSLARTWGERRKEVSLDPLEKDTPKEYKWFAELMSTCPVDPGLSGAWSTLAALLVKAKVGDGSDDNDVDNKGAPMTSTRDPAKKPAHGAEAGIRRDSAAEKESAGSK